MAKNKVKQEIIDICKRRHYGANIYPKDSLARAKSKFRKSLFWINWLLPEALFIEENLSIEFVREFKAQLNWVFVSQYQSLSESFIEEFQDEVDWRLISKFQRLSEKFIRKFHNKVMWYNIEQYQILSEDFILEQYNAGHFNIKHAFYYQKLSPEFRKKFGLKTPKHNYLYTSNKNKIQLIRLRSYKIIDDKYIIAYKSVRHDYCSIYAPLHFKYEIGKTYVSHCDCNLSELYSFGLSAWTKEGAISYHSNGRLLKVKIDIKDIGAIVGGGGGGGGGGKIRCRKLTVLEEVSLIDE